MTTYTFTVTGMHCASCGLLIDETLEEEVPGVQRAETSLRAGRTTVHVDATVAPAAVIAAIAQAGYTAILAASS